MPLMDNPIMSRIKSIAFSCISGLRLPRILHKISPRDRLTIVMYHSVIRSPLPANDWCFLPESSFQEQMSYLRKHFDVIPLREAAKKLREGSLRRPTAAITFDDGFQNNYDVAFPILKKEGLPAAIFLVTGLVDTNETVWFCRLHEAVIKTRKTKVEWRGTSFDVSTSGAKSFVSAVFQERLKAFASPEFFKELARLFRILDYDPSRSVEAGSPFRMLSRAAIREMVASGLIEFGAHACSHMILNQLSEAESAREIRESVSAVSEMTERPCRLFSYPNGRACDYSRRAVETLEQSGVGVAVTTTAGPNDCRTPSLELKRYGIGNDTTRAQFQIRAHHFLHPF